MCLANSMWYVKKIDINLTKDLYAVKETWLHAS